MIGSWAGAMGHTQWMPEVWLHVGIDYDGDGKISPYGPPDDALASTARFFVERGSYRRGEHWGYEVRMPAELHGGRSRSYAAWQALGVTRADGEPFPQAMRDGTTLAAGAGRSGLPGRPEFFRREELQPVDEPMRSRLVHLGDRCSAAGPSCRKFPGSEPAPTLAELQEIQARLTALGFDSGGADGRIGGGDDASGAQFSAQSGHRAGRRLCRRGTSCPLAPRLVTWS